MGFLREEQGQFPLPRPSGFPPRNFLFLSVVVVVFVEHIFLVVENFQVLSLDRCCVRIHTVSDLCAGEDYVLQLDA